MDGVPTPLLMERIRSYQKTLFLAAIMVLLNGGCKNAITTIPDDVEAVKFVETYNGFVCASNYAVGLRSNGKTIHFYDGCPFLVLGYPNAYEMSEKIIGPVSDQWDYLGHDDLYWVTFFVNEDKSLRRNDWDNYQEEYSRYDALDDDLKRKIEENIHEILLNPKHVSYAKDRKDYERVSVRLNDKIPYIYSISFYYDWKTIGELHGFRDGSETKFKIGLSGSTYVRKSLITE